MLNNILFAQSVQIDTLSRPNVYCVSAIDELYNAARCVRNADSGTIIILDCLGGDKNNAIQDALDIACAVGKSDVIITYSGVTRQYARRLFTLLNRSGNAKQVIWQRERSTREPIEV